MKKINILIVDDHPLIRDGLRTMLESQTKQAKFVVYEAENQNEAVHIVQNNKLDVVIMDFQLQDEKGHEVTETLLKLNNKLRILGLSNYDEYVYALDMLKAGAKGYVLKNVGIKELIGAILQVLDGKVYYSNEIANKLINFKLKELLLQEDKDSFAVLAMLEQETPLSFRELQIVRLIATEYTNDEIAKELELSKRTIDNHRQNMLNKLQLRNTAGLVRYAVENRLV